VLLAGNLQEYWLVECTSGILYHQCLALCTCIVQRYCCWEVSGGYT
jgi:hypothetical protein